MPRLHVPDLDPSSTRVALPEGEAHHVARVLRLRAGDAVRVFDGRGREWDARLAPTERRSAATVELVQEIAPIPEPSVRVTLAAGILKGDHMDAIVRDATMMGAVEILPLVTEHVTVPRKAWQGSAALERWRRVAVASAKQCGRAVVPEITPPMDLDSALSRRPGQTAVMFVEPAIRATTRKISELPPPSGGVLVLIGPEGGWSGEEIERAIGAGAVLADLGPRTIRADAMATAALASLGSVFNR